MPLHLHFALEDSASQTNVPWQWNVMYIVCEVKLNVAINNEQFSINILQYRRVFRALSNI